MRQPSFKGTVEAKQDEISAWTNTDSENTVAILDHCPIDRAITDQGAEGHSMTTNANEAEKSSDLCEAEVEADQEFYLDMDESENAKAFLDYFNGTGVLPGSRVRAKLEDAKTPSVVETVLMVSRTIFASISCEGISRKVPASDLDLIEIGPWKSKNFISARVSYAFAGDVRTTDVVGLTLTPSGAEAAILADDNVVETTLLRPSDRPVMLGDTIAFQDAPEGSMRRETVVGIEVVKESEWHGVVYETSNFEGIKDPLLIEGKGLEATPAIGTMAFDRKTGGHGWVGGWRTSDEKGILIKDASGRKTWIDIADLAIDDGLKDQIAPGDECVALLGNEDKSRRYVGRVTKVAKEKRYSNYLTVTLELEDLEKIDFSERLIVARRKGPLHPLAIKIGMDVQAMVKSNNGMRVQFMEARSHAIENDGHVTFEVADRDSERMVHLRDEDVFPGIKEHRSL